MKKILKQYGFYREIQYYDFILQSIKELPIESFTEGSRTLFKAMPVRERKKCFQYMVFSGYVTAIQIFDLFYSLF